MVVPLTKLFSPCLHSYSQNKSMNPITNVILASMVTPFETDHGLLHGKVFGKNIFNKQEVETLKTALSYEGMPNLKVAPNCLG